MPLHMLREIEKLKRQVLTLCGIVENSVSCAVRSVRERDPALAQCVIDTDAQIDQAEVDVEEECQKIIALYQPVAGDLRFVIAVLKINNDLERVGDLAVNIAERSLAMARFAPITPPYDLAEMEDKSQSMLRRSLDALMNLDEPMARAVLLADDDVDEINRMMFSLVYAAIRRHPEHVEVYLNHLSVSRNLERIADYATNIAEDVMYLVSGEIVRHKIKTHQHALPDVPGDTT